MPGRLRRRPAPRGPPRRRRQRRRGGFSRRSQGCKHRPSARSSPRRASRRYSGGCRSCRYPLADPSQDRIIGPPWPWRQGIFERIVIQGGKLTFLFGKLVWAVLQHGNLLMLCLLAGIFLFLISRGRRCKRLVGMSAWDFALLT